MASVMELDRAERIYLGDKEVLCIMLGDQEIYPNFHKVTNKTIFYSPYTSDGRNKSSSGGDKPFRGPNKGIVLNRVEHPNGFDSNRARKAKTLYANFWVKNHAPSNRSTSTQIMLFKFWHQISINFYHRWDSNFINKMECLNNRGRYEASGTHNVGDGNWHMVSIIMRDGNFSVYVDGQIFWQKNNSRARTAGDGTMQLVSDTATPVEISQFYVADENPSAAQIKSLYDKMKGYYI